MQVGTLLNAAFLNLSATYGEHAVLNYFYNSTQSRKVPQHCGLQVYGISSCPWSALADINAAKATLAAKNLNYRRVYNNGTFPSLTWLINPSNNMSFLNLDFGLPAWIQLMYYLGYSDLTQFTMVHRDDIAALHTRFVMDLAHSFFPSPGEKDILRCELLIAGVAYYLQHSWVDAFPSQLTAMVYNEWQHTYSPKLCAPNAMYCVWQWGYVLRQGSSDGPLSASLVQGLINPSSASSNQPSSLYYDGSSAMIYNTFVYCNSQSYASNETVPCEDVDYAKQDALLTFPAVLFATQYGLSTLNISELETSFQRLSSANRTRFTRLGCSIANLVYGVYPNATDFHDNYVIKYINLHKDPNLAHNFSTGNWKELGWAQFAGGFITQAIVGVRALYQVIRDGMWRIGPADYYAQYVEYSTWAVRRGYPQAWMYDLTKVKYLLDMLSSSNSSALEFRRDLLYKHTTLIGDGKDFINGIGAVGERAYSVENNLANFSCNHTRQYTQACAVLNQYFTSSVAHCSQVNAMYQSCIKALLTNRWITNCGIFETTLTNPQSLSGVECDATGVGDNPHPYSLSRGNLLCEMVLVLVVNIILKEGLWCRSAADCDYDVGGLFITTTVTKFLFEGYFDNSVVRYLNLKHVNDGVRFICLNNQTGACGVLNYRCSDEGLVLQTQNGLTNFTLASGVTPPDQYFAPYFDVTPDGELVWSYSLDPVLAARAKELLNMYKNNIVRVRNPIWAMYPLWNSNNSTLQKYFQCQKRLADGSPNLFASCLNTIDTGLTHLINTQSTTRLQGNDSVRHSNRSAHVTGFDSTQFGPHLWKGFR
eukprot:gene3325-4117_t